MNYKDITSYEAACKLQNIDPNLLPDVSMLSEEEGKDVINSVKLKRVFRAINYNHETDKYWEPNWNDRSEVKYFPWVEVEADEQRPGGFGFSSSIYVYWSTITFAGSRLCTDSSDKIFHLFEHFGELMLDYFLIRK